MPTTKSVGKETFLIVDGKVGMTLLGHKATNKRHRHESFPLA